MRLLLKTKPLKRSPKKRNAPLPLQMKLKKTLKLKLKTRRTTKEKQNPRKLLLKELKKQPNLLKRKPTKRSRTNPLNLKTSRDRMKRLQTSPLTRTQKILKKRQRKKPSLRLSPGSPLRSTKKTGQSLFSPMQILNWTTRLSGRPVPRTAMNGRKPDMA